MNSTLGDVFGCILCLILLFVGPIYDAFQTNDKLVDTMANGAINSFQKDVRKNGYIDFKEYNKFLNELSKTGRVYKVTMIHTSNLVYPSVDNQNDYEINQIKYGTENILEAIKDGNSKYCMRYGDSFKVTITENEIAPSRLLTKMISSNKGESLLVFSNGGMVENEVYE